MEEDFRMELADGSMTPVNKLASIGKLCQITSNFMKNTETKEVIKIDKENPKLNLLKSRIEDCLSNEESVIVFAWFRQEIADIEDLCKSMGITSVSCHGDVTAEERMENMRMFQEKEAPVFIGQIKASATGLTLTAASRVIYYSSCFSLGLRQQSEDRAHRIGQNSDVIYEDMIAIGTISEKILKVKDIKHATFNELFGNP
jgi:SNF2 family DNA or RNA helicase